LSFNSEFNLELGPDHKLINLVCQDKVKEWVWHTFFIVIHFDDTRLGIQSKVLLIKSTEYTYVDRGRDLCWIPNLIQSVGR